MEAGIALKRKEDNLSGVMAPLIHRALVEEDLGEPRRAITTMIESIRMSLGFGDTWLAAQAGILLARMVRMYGRADDAVFADALEAAIGNPDLALVIGPHTGAEPHGSPAVIPGLVDAIEAMLLHIPTSVPRVPGARFTGVAVE